MKNPNDKHLKPLTAHDYIGVGSWIGMAILFGLLFLGKI